MGNAISFDYVGVADVLVGLISIVVASTLVLWQRNRSGLSFAVISDVELSLKQSKFRLGVYYEDSELARPRALVMRLANSGNKPIPTTDFETPITFRLESTKVIAAEITYRRPADLAATATVPDDREIQIEPLLLNKRDLIELQILGDGQPANVRAMGRIQNISRIERQTVPRDSWGQPWRISFWSFLVAILTIAMMVVLAVWFMASSPNLFGAIGGGLFLGFAIAIYPLFQLNRLKSSSLFLDPR